MPLLPDRVHVIPAGGRIAVKDGVVHLSAAVKDHGPRLPLDFLFASLAHEAGLRVVVIVLSGNGADGAEGVRAISTAGGHVIAQEPTEAGHDSMPLAAIATGCVDEVLPVAAMGAAIIAQRDLAAGPDRATAAATSLGNATATPVAALESVQPVLARLKRSGHDFSGYKTGTMQRRIERRARLAGYAGDDPVSRYVARLDNDPIEVKALANDLLINVTSFFRDEAVFVALSAQSIPELVRTHSGDRPLRLWSAGCSSGEEAWSLAMLVLVVVLLAVLLMTILTMSLM
jgi:two-component system CheB/CheR fusion protein